MNISHCPARFGGSACLLARTFGAPLGDGYTNAASPPIFSIEQAAFSALQRARGSARSTLLNFGGEHSLWRAVAQRRRSEEHTSELQSLRHLVCRLLLEKKKE